MVVAVSQNGHTGNNNNDYHHSRPHSPLNDRYCLFGGSPKVPQRSYTDETDQIKSGQHRTSTPLSSGNEKMTSQGQRMKVVCRFRPQLPFELEQNGRNCAYMSKDQVRSGYE